MDSPCLNFRMVTGKQRKSKIYVKEPYTYVLDQMKTCSIDSSVLLYLRCRHSSCPARAIVTDGFLSTAGSKQQHNCNSSDENGMNKITVLEISAKMKMRAEMELSKSIWVIAMFIFIFM